MSKRPVMLVLCVFALALLLSGCAAGPAADAPPPVRLDLAASGDFATLEPGQELVIRLESNPSTGYDWQVVKYSKELLSLEEDEYIPPENARIGQGGTKHFAFKALKPGSTVLELAYYRPWEGTEDAADWFQLIVEIHQDSP